MLDDNDLRVLSEVDGFYAEFAGFEGKWLGGVRERLIAGAIRESNQTEEGLSRDQAIRDIRRLQQTGIVESAGYCPTLHYVAAGELQASATSIAASLTAPPVEPYQPVKPPSRRPRSRR